MKGINTITTIILLVVGTGCGGGKQSTNDYITIDVTKSYPKKELILQDFMDVEYIVLETNDEFVTQGIVLAIGKNFIIVKNQVRDGNIFIFDRNGKGVRNINRIGQGPEDYTNISGIVIDEDNGEIFVNDEFAKKIMVYDLNGQFKRTLPHVDDYQYRNEIYIFNNNSLICKDASFDSDEANKKAPFVIISKQTGSIINDIQIPYTKKIIPSVTFTIEMNGNSMPVGAGYVYFPIIPYHDSWILTEASSDTVFRYFPDGNKIPFIVRTPSIQSMNPEVFLFPRILADRFYFMQTTKREYNEEIRKAFPTIELAYDRQEKAIFETTVYNDDFSNKRIVDMKRETIRDDEVAFHDKIEAYELMEANEKGLLKARLKEIAEELNEDDNPVIMLVKHKK